ncbi:Cupin 2 conserved barrel domain protein [Burkholderia sp. H160]|nr:Cupin 2 conserved barrel domain protein [Burkholderia sp. H160]
MQQALPTVRRIVTGHDIEGKAIVVSDRGILPRMLAAIPGTAFHEVWATLATPAPIDNSADPLTGPLMLPPPKDGTRIRFVDIPPDTEEFLKHGAAQMKSAFSEIGSVEASTVEADSPHPLMHRTESVDYGILIEGELVLILDREEVTLTPGSVVIQRGTNHAWANRSDKMARMLFILIDGVFAPEIREQLEPR